jgi:hypothetical protein
MKLVAQGTLLQEWRSVPLGYAEGRVVATVGFAVCGPVRSGRGAAIVTGKEDFIGQLSKGLDAQFAQLAERTRRVRANKSTARPVSVDENP